MILEPVSSPDFQILLQSLYEQKTPYFILGGGSNLVIADEGIPVPVLLTRSLCAIEHTASNDGNCLLSCLSGASMESVTDYCIEHELEGLENFAGLPGTAGGAVFMNARCYEKSISDVLSRVYYLAHTAGHFTEYAYDFCVSDWAYKVSPFQKTKNPVTAAVFCVKKGDKENVEQKCAQFLADRKQKRHFDYPSAGSVFKNNHSFGKPSGKIIDEAGLKGLRLGGAQIAPWHGNFIINADNASARDVRNLVLMIQETVLEKFGFNLEPEIIFTQDLF